MSLWGFESLFVDFECLDFFEVFSPLELFGFFRWRFLLNTRLFLVVFLSKMSRPFEEIGLGGLSPWFEAFILVIKLSIRRNKADLGFLGKRINTLNSDKVDVSSVFPLFLLLQLVSHSQYMDTLHFGLPICKILHLQGFVSMILNHQDHY